MHFEASHDSRKQPSSTASPSGGARLELAVEAHIAHHLHLPTQHRSPHTVAVLLPDLCPLARSAGPAELTSLVSPDKLAGAGTRLEKLIFVFVILAGSSLHRSERASASARSMQAQLSASVPACAGIRPGSRTAVARPASASVGEHPPGRPRCVEEKSVRRRASNPMRTAAWLLRPCMHVRCACAHSYRSDP